MRISVIREGRLRRSVGGTTAVLLCLLGLSALPANAEPVGEIAAALADQIPVITNPQDGTTIHDLPIIDGTGEPNSTVVITDDSGAQVCSGVVSEVGYFSCSGTQLLPAGSPTLTVTTTSANGSTVGNTVQISTVYYPAVTWPEAGALISRTQSFSGTALPGVQVQLLAADARAVCTTTTDEWGNFNCIPERPLPLGALTLSPSMTGADGGITTREPMSWTVISEPVITSPADGAITGDRPVFSGTGHPGADINIVHGRSGSTMCTAKIAADGSFSCGIDQPLMVGSLEVLPSTSVGGVGSVIGTMITISVEVTPTILRPALGEVVSEFPVIEGTAGVRSGVAIEDERGTTVCSTVANEMGIFGCAVTNAALTPGPHTLTPVQTSFAGVVVRGAAISVTVPGSVPGVTPSASPRPSPTSSSTATSTTTAAPTTPATQSQTAAATKPPTVAKSGTTRALAATGATGTTPILLVGGLLILLGAAVVVAKIRRRSREH